MAKLLIIIGVVLVAVGVAMKLGLPIGRLPGDIVVKRDHTTFYFPIVTCLVVSAILTLLAALIRR
jgi:uncharacterized membrane protein YczE